MPSHPDRMINATVQMRSYKNIVGQTGTVSSMMLGQINFGAIKPVHLPLSCIHVAVHSVIPALLLLVSHILLRRVQDCVEPQDLLLAAVV